MPPIARAKPSSAIGPVPRSTESSKSSRPIADGMTISSTKVTAVTDVTGPRCRARAKKSVPMTPWTTMVQTSG